METVKVKYAFTCRATMLGAMSIPKAMFDRLPEGDAWSDEIEKFIVERHDFLHQPPEIDDDFEMDDVVPIPNED